NLLAVMNEVGVTHPTFRVATVSPYMFLSTKRFLVKIQSTDAGDTSAGGPETGQISITLTNGPPVNPVRVVYVDSEPIKLLTMTRDKRASKAPAKKGT